MRTPLGYYGGKVRLASWLADLLPDRAGYVEPFAGMASVLFARPPAPRGELLNDANERVINWWRVVQNPEQRAELAERLMWTPHSAEMLDPAYAAWESDDPVDMAWAFAVLSRQQIGFGGTPANRKSAWKGGYPPMGGTGRSGAGTAFHLEAIRDRLARVSLTCEDARQVIDRTAVHEGNAIYCDPPYSGAVTNEYAEETVIDDFAELLVDRPAAIALSGPGHELLQDDGWEHHQRDHLITVGTGNSNRNTVEHLWLNRAAQTARDEGRLW